VGTKAVNALSSFFKVESVRDGKMKAAEFSQGQITEDAEIQETTTRKGTRITFIPDESLFPQYTYRHEHVDRMLWNYAYLNRGLVINFNGQRYESKDGLKDLLKRNTDEDPLYPIIHLEGDDIEVAITHTQSYGEDYYSFVNGQYTPQGGTHQSAFRESLARVIKDHYGKNFDSQDVRTSISAAVSVKVMEPVFESQTKTKLGSQDIGPDGPSMRAFINDFLSRELDNYLHKHPEVSERLLKKILQSERERKEMAGVKKLARERAKKANLHNKKLRDCRVHLGDKDERSVKTSIFICEGDSASGSITKIRDVNTQAVFSLKGKPLNTYGLTKKIVYENEEFNLLQAALNIEDGIENLRYNNVIIATDADVDGMHIRLLLITFFLQFFPEIVKQGHLYVLQTPLFRVRNKKETAYCYSEDERREALKKLGKNAEITRFKGLGEISPDEFKHFVGKDIRLDPVVIGQDAALKELLSFYMGKNTPDRQEFIIENLKVEKDVIEEAA
ncbi:MAG: toprim domain-containing protein, partial [Salibacteraceae bacterium]